LTGSVNTGRAVSHELAESTTPSVMELSGCDAVFVLEDADLNLVSDCLLMGLTLNRSQTCMAPRRVFARDWQADEILRLLKSKLKERGVSTLVERDKEEGLDGPTAKPTASPQTSPQTSRLRFPEPASRLDRMQEQLIAAAIAEGAELVVGSTIDGGCPESMELTILDHVSSEMAIAQKDLFAPVLSFIRVDSDSRALQENEKCPYALSATVFGSARECQKFARRIPAGCVVINDMIVPTADPRVPFGGRDLSGHGKTRGQAGLLEMTHLKAIVASRRWFKPHLHQPTAADSVVLEQLIRLEHAANPLQSLKALPRMMQATIQQIKLRSSLENKCVEKLSALSQERFRKGTES
jgi:acyl-CoA reductase-like NAD-dependent aldehyde dehydrogenase